MVPRAPPEREHLLALELELEERCRLPLLQLHQLHLALLQDQLHELVPLHEERELQVQLLPQPRHQCLLAPLALRQPPLHLAEPQEPHLLRPLLRPRRPRCTPWEWFEQRP